MQKNKQSKGKKKGIFPVFFMGRRLNVKDIRHYSSIEAEQGMDYAGYEGSQVDWVG